VCGAGNDRARSAVVLIAFASFNTASRRAPKRVKSMAKVKSRSCQQPEDRRALAKIK
jgi:hypothetical protein